jgi:hypothetical protein
MVKYRKATRKDSDKIFEYGNKYFKVGQYPYSLWNQKDLNKFLVKPNIAIVAEDEEELVGWRLTPTLQLCRQIMVIWSGVLSILTIVARASGPSYVVR